MHPQDLGNRLLRSHTGLRDCFTETDMFDVSSLPFTCIFSLFVCPVFIRSITFCCSRQGCEDGHTLIADNHFTKKQDLIPFEKGIRIDYILIKVN